jgi:hypothetical protein
MPRFYFHLHDDADVSDESGTELADIESARARAATMALFEVSESVKRDGRIIFSHRIDIHDENGAVVAIVHFGDVVQVTP